MIAPLTTTVMNALPTHQSGVASGVNNAITRAAGLLAIATLGLVVVSTFNASLDTRLRHLAISPAVQTEIYVQRSKLVGASIPAGVSRVQAFRIETALKESFLSGFRVGMVVSALLALASAIIAAWLVSGRRSESTETAPPSKASASAVT